MVLKSVIVSVAVLCMYHATAQQPAQTEAQTSELTRANREEHDSSNHNASSKLGDADDTPCTCVKYYECNFTHLPNPNGGSGASKSGNIGLTRYCDHYLQVCCPPNRIILEDTDGSAVGTVSGGGIGGGIFEEPTDGSAEGGIGGGIGGGTGPQQPAQPSELTRANREEHDSNNHNVGTKLGDADNTPCTCVQYYECNPVIQYQNDDSGASKPENIELAGNCDGFYQVCCPPNRINLEPANGSAVGTASGGGIGGGIGGETGGETGGGIGGGIRGGTGGETGGGIGGGIGGGTGGETGGGIVE